MTKRLNIDGYIVHQDDKWMYDFFEMSSVTQKDVRNFLNDADGDEIELFIDCFGGDVFTASNIYAELRAYKGKSTAHIVGLSASASTVVMLGCDTVIGAPTSQYMMHNAGMIAKGNHKDMEHAAEELVICDNSIINAYEIKTGMKREDLAAIMDKETWMTAQEALRLGFIDSISLKEGEALSDMQISAVMSMSGRAYAVASINTMKMHEMAQRLKEKPKDEIPPITKETETAEIEGGFLVPENSNESGGEITEVIKKQRELFTGIRRKLIEF